MLIRFVPAVTVPAAVLRRVAAVLCLACGAVCGQAQAMEVAPPAASEAGTEDEGPRALAETIRRLRQASAADPANLGLLLDLAIAYCRAAQADDAMRLFLLLEARDDLPEAIGEVIGWYRESGCAAHPRPPAGRAPGVAFAAAGVGYARNLNLAPLSDQIFLPSIGQTLTLADSSRRRDAAFGTAEAGGQWPLDARGRWSAGGYVQGLRYDGSPDYALTTAQLALNWRDQAPGGAQVTEAQLGLARVHVGRGTRLENAGLTATRLWRVTDAWWSGLTAAATRLDYRAEQALDAQQLEVKGRVRWQGTTARATADLGWLEDHEVAQRPGGDRSGPVLQLRGTWALRAGRTLDATLRHGWLHDSAPYSPAVFDEQRRRPRTTVLMAALRQPLDDRWSVRVEYRLTVSRDSIALFDYNAQSVWTALEWSFSAPGR